MSNRSTINFIRNNSIFRRLIWSIQQRRCSRLVKRIKPYLRHASTLLDVGAGTCNTSKILQDQGYQVTALDIVDLSFTDEVHPVLYDGYHMPFEDKQFDVAIIITSLHHCKDPDQVVREAARVANHIVIIEDVYRNRWHKYITWYYDSLLNLEFRGHPHTNKDDKGWLSLFETLDLKLIGRQANWSMLFMWHVTYCLANESIQSTQVDVQ